LWNAAADESYKFGKLLEDFQMTIIEGVGLTGKHFQDARDRSRLKYWYDCNRTQSELPADFGV
jgi:hypothetical protein